MVKSLHTPRYEAFCRLIQEAREKAGLTQLELAERIGKPQSFVSKFERGERRLDVIEFLLICRALGAEPTAVLRRLIGRLEK